MAAQLASDEFIYITGDEVRAICQDLDHLALIREVFFLHGSGRTVLPEEAYLEWNGDVDEPVRSINMPAFVGGIVPAVGTKIINSNPANIRRGIPRASGIVVLFDPRTVRVRCIMEGAYLSAVRTAAVSMLAASLVGRQDAKVMTVIGAGAVGRTHIELAAKWCPTINKVKIFDREVRVANETAASVSSLLDNALDIEVSPTAELAVANSELVIASTTTTRAYIPYQWLQPGALVVNVSLDDLLPDVFQQADLLFVDDWNLVRSDTRRLLGKLHREGVVVGPHEKRMRLKRRVDAEISDLVLNRHPGRTSPDQIVVVNPFGLAIEDVLFASKVLEVALEFSMGTKVRL